MTIEELTEKFCEGVTSAANKRIDEIYFSIYGTIDENEKINELIKHFRDTYYYLIEYEEGDNAYFFRIQRSEFSKQKYFYFDCSYTFIGFGRMLPTFCYSEVTEENFATIPVSMHLDNWELISILEKIKSYNIDTIQELSAIMTQLQKTYDYGIEPDESEPIKPKGNPYAGESWKDRKHKFKSKR